MAPATPIHALSALEAQINVLPSGKPRKPPVRLSDCALKELVQYKCNIEVLEKTRKPTVICEPVVRLLRQ
jgi:inner membrane protease subunit SOM1